VRVPSNLPGPPTCSSRRRRLLASSPQPLRCAGASTKLRSSSGAGASTSSRPPTAAGVWYKHLDGGFPVQGVARGHRSASVSRARADGPRAELLAPVGRHVQGLEPACELEECILLVKGATAANLHHEPPFQSSAPRAELLPGLVSNTHSATPHSPDAGCSGWLPPAARNRRTTHLPPTHQRRAHMSPEQRTARCVAAPHPLPIS
jgi:hypothetical protein